MYPIVYVIPVCVFVVYVCVGEWTVNHKVSPIPIQMQDSGMQDENIQLLGDEGLRAGGQQAMKLG